MRYINIDHLEAGMKLGKAVVYETGNGKKLPLITANTILTENMIQILSKRDFKGVYIDDELSNGIYAEDMFTEEQISSAIAAVRDKNLDKIVESSQNLVKQAYGNKKMNFDLLRMIESNDKDSHAFNVCEIALAIGNLLNLKHDELVNLSNAALLHDIGKYLSANDMKRIDDMIPSSPIKIDMERKPENMSKIDFLHPTYGFYYLVGFPIINAVTKQTILFSHENDLGLGYPYGLEQDKRVLNLSKIINIADRYDHYLKTYGNPVNARIMLLNDYSQGFIDKDIAEVFIKRVPIYPICATVLLSNGELAVVERNNVEFPECPVVKTESGEKIDLAQARNITIIDLYCGKNNIEKEEIEAINNMQK